MFQIERKNFLVITLHKKMKLPINNFFSKRDQIRSLLEKFLMENFIFCTVLPSVTREYQTLQFVRAEAVTQRYP